jgi:hypothetical protein
MATAFLLFILIFSITLIVASIKRKKGIDTLTKHGFTIRNFCNGGSLAGGHPDIDKEITHVKILANNEKFAICDISFSPKGEILKNQVKDVVLENASTFEKRISAGRLLLVGAFALAWKKKSRNENAYVIVEWNDGRFDHSTSFLFEGTGSVQNANSARNWMIKQLR